MRSFTIEQAAMLTEVGYTPGWLSDVEDGDEVAFTTGPSFMKADNEPEMFMWRVERVQKQPRYVDVSNGLFGGHMTQNGVLVMFIAYNDDGIPLQQTYGGEWPCFIRRAQATP